MSDEARRVREEGAAWRRWGPYLTERQWGTVREDYSPDGTAWDHLTHDMARSKAYRWGEEGIAGWSDEGQRLCLALALWNGNDPILKERLFGLTGPEGNHGEDVKELYYYLDAVPSHAYQRMRYVYPQAAFPYADLVDENGRRGKLEPEYELIETGVLDGDRYFDVVVEIAKADPEDVLYRVTVTNRGPEAAALHVLPTVWFRNTWSVSPGQWRPELRLGDGRIEAYHEELGDRQIAWDGDPRPVFCDNETNTQLLYGTGNATGPFKDGINDLVTAGDENAVHPSVGTKAALWHRLEVPAGGSVSVRLRMSETTHDDPMGEFDGIVERRQQEANEFYEELQADLTDSEARAIQRQAFAGMLWTKQYYGFDVERWHDGDPGQPPPPPERRTRPQRGMAAPQQRRHHLHARHLGVPVVRHLGSGVPLSPARTARPGVRQAAAGAHDP